MDPYWADKTLAFVKYAQLMAVHDPQIRNHWTTAAEMLDTQEIDHEKLKEIFRYMTAHEENLEPGSCALIRDNILRVVARW